MGKHSVAEGKTLSPKRMKYQHSYPTADLLLQFRLHYTVLGSGRGKVQINIIYRPAMSYPSSSVNWANMLLVKHIKPTISHSVHAEYRQ